MSGIDGGVPLSDREAAFEDRISGLMDRVGQTGWIFGGGDNMAEETTSVGFSLEPGLCVVAPDVVASLLPIRDDEGNLYAGYYVDTNEEDGVSVGYDGPVDSRFERVIDAMVNLAKTPEDIEAEKAANIGRHVIRAANDRDPVFIVEGRHIIAAVVPTSFSNLVMRMVETNPDIKRAFEEAQAEVQIERADSETLEV